MKYCAQQVKDTIKQGPYDLTEAKTQTEKSVIAGCTSVGVMKKAVLRKKKNFVSLSHNEEDIWKLVQEKLLSRRQTTSEYYSYIMH